MTSTVIQIEKLSKCYHLGTIGGGTLRADVSRWLAKLRGPRQRVYGILGAEQMLRPVPDHWPAQQRLDRS